MLVGDAILVIVAIAGARMARAVAFDQRRTAVDAGLVRARLGQHRRLVGVVEFVLVEHLVDLGLLVVVEIGRHHFGRFVPGAHRAERGHLDDLAAEEHVREPEAPADEPAVAEGALDLLRQRAGRDVEVLRGNPEQQVAHAATDEESLVTGFAQAVQHAQRIGRDRGPRYGMFGTGNDACGWPGGRIGFVQDFKVPLGRRKAAHILPRSILDPPISTLPSSRGPGHGPLKAVTPVRIR